MKSFFRVKTWLVSFVTKTVGFLTVTGSIFLLTILLLIAILVGQKVPYHKGVAALESQVSQGPKPEYISGEILVKFKPGGANFKNSTEKMTQEVDFDKKPVSFSDLDLETLAPVLKVINEKYEIKTIEKVFKGVQDPQTELIKFKQKFTQEEFLERRINEKELSKIDLSRTYKISFDKKTPLINVLQELAQSSEVEYAEPNFLYKIQFRPDDPYYLDHYPDIVGSRDPSWNPLFDYQWGLKRINIERAWDITMGNQEIVVGLVDTGVDYTHSELQNKVILGRDFVNLDDDPVDDHGHGTHLAGIVAAQTNNALGIAGVAPAMSILAIKGIGSGGSGPADVLANAVYYAGQNGARIINASWGSPAPSQVLKEAINVVTQGAGVIFIASAGNDSSDSRFYYPAGWRNVITVGSSDINDLKSDFSNNVGIDFLAPGGNSKGQDGGDDSFINILSLRAENTDMYGDGRKIIGQEYYRARGTSMAAAFVSGAAALLLAKTPATSEEIRSILRATAVKTEGGKIWNKDSGYGRIDLAEALAQGRNFNVARITGPDTVTILGNTLDLSFIANGNNFSEWILDYGPDLDPSEWTQIGRAGQQSNTIQTISFDTSTLKNPGNYTFRLRVLPQDSSGKYIEDRLILIRPPGLKWSFSPPSPELFVTSSPAVSDLDGDGKKEIVVASGNMPRVYILGFDGRLINTIDTSPETIGYLTGSVAIADLLPQVSGKEILITTEKSPEKKLRLFTANGNEYREGGWPILLGTGMVTERDSPPRIVDLDGDGTFEILTSSGNRVFVLNRDGYPLSSGWPKTLNGTLENSVYGGKFVDPRSNELQILTVDRAGNVSLFDLAGTLLRSFSIPSGEKTPAIVFTDLDSDGIQEIIAKYEREGTQKIASYTPEGNLLWQKSIGIAGFNETYPVPVVSDLNQDGEKEIVVSDEKGIWFFSKDGNPISDWPHFGWFNVMNFSSGNYNGDSNQEIYFSRSIPPGVGVIEKGKINFYFPLPGLVTFIGPVIADLEGDGFLDLIIHTSFGGSLFVYDLGVKNIQTGFNLRWPQYLFNEQRISADGICLKLFCDINNDGRENTDDGNFFKSCFGKSSPLGQCRKVDVVCDEKINIFDFVKYGISCPQIFSSPLPDLKVKNLTLPKFFLRREAIIKADISNDGKGNANDSFKIGLFMRKKGALIGKWQKVGETKLGSLGSGKIQAVSFVWTPKAAGRYDLKVQADIDNTIKEENEENNEVVVEITVYR